MINQKVHQQSKVYHKHKKVAKLSLEAFPVLERICYDLNGTSN